MKIKYISTIAAASLIVVLGTGCGSSKRAPQPQTVQIPQWYINAPQDNEKFLYGEGEGDTLKEAKANALSSMSSKLIVTVSSSLKTMTNSTTSSNGSSSYSKNVSKLVNMNTEKIKFTNAKIEHQAFVNYTYYALVSVDRIELFKNKKREFDLNDQRIDKKYNSMKNFALLEKIHILQDSIDSIIKAKHDAVVLNAINNKFNYETYIKKYDSYLDKLDQLKAEATIYVTSNSSYKFFQDTLIDMLNQQRFKVVETPKSDIQIKINNKIRYNKARGWYIAKISTVLSVISNNKIVSNYIINTIGRSSTSKENAIESASREFGKKIEKETLDKVIFSKNKR